MKNKSGKESSARVRLSSVKFKTVFSFKFSICRINKDMRLFTDSDFKLVKNIKLIFDFFEFYNKFLIDLQFYIFLYSNRLQSLSGKENEYPFMTTKSPFFKIRIV